MCSIDNVSESGISLINESATNLVQNVSYDFFDLANAAGKFASTPQSKMALDNFFHKLKYLEKEWYEFGSRYQQIVRRNEQLTLEFERERHKAKVYQKRLKFVKENQENVERLHELYDGIKCLEQKTFSEKVAQTEGPNDVLSFDKDALKSAKDTLNTIREMVQKRESRHDENTKRLSFLTERVENLEVQNKELTQLLKEKIAEQKMVNKYNDCGIGVEKKECEKKLKWNNVRQSLDSRQNRDYIDPDVEFPLRAIQSMKSSLTATMSKVRSVYDLPLASEEILCKKNKNMECGDCKEVEILKRIRTEIEKKQQIIKSKIDVYNDLFK